MKPFPRRFVVDLDEMECYSEANHEVIALITDAETEAPTTDLYEMSGEERLLRTTEKLRLCLRMMQT